MKSRPFVSAARAHNNSILHNTPASDHSDCVQLTVNSVSVVQMFLKSCWFVFLRILTWGSFRGFYCDLQQNKVQQTHTHTHLWEVFGCARAWESSSTNQSRDLQEQFDPGGKSAGLQQSLTSLDQRRVLVRVRWKCYIPVIVLEEAESFELMRVIIWSDINHNLNHTSQQGTFTHFFKVMRKTLFQ